MFYRGKRNAGDATLAHTTKACFKFHVDFALVLVQKMLLMYGAVGKIKEAVDVFHKGCVYIYHLLVTVRI